MQLSREQFSQISPYLPRQRGNVSLDNYDVLNAILYVAEHGSKWRGLPQRFGRWHTIYTRMSRWAKAGVLDRVFAAMQQHQLIRTDTARAVDVAPVVDVLQADASRCGGYTGFLAIDGFCSVTHMPLSSHCGPLLHLHVAAASLMLRHMEYFHDHVRIEHMLFEGCVEPIAGMLSPDRSRPGRGMVFKHADALRYLI